jgi:hypothetical protein
MSPSPFAAARAAVRPIDRRWLMGIHQLQASL